MFSDVGHIISSQQNLIGEAETTDARLLRQRREDLHSKNKDKRDKDRSSAGEYMYEPTGNSISLDAVYDFLVNLAQSKASLGAGLEPDALDGEMNDSASLFDAIDSIKLNTIRRKYESARAANAYEHAAHTAGQSRIHRIDQSNQPYLGLQNISNAQLYTLIKDVELMRRQGVQTLSIPKKSSFLESLILAVEDEKLKRREAVSEL